MVLDEVVPSRAKARRERAGRVAAPRQELIRVDERIDTPPIAVMGVSRGGFSS
jgi:hypothetical protein